ncbi:helix-turn-helix domain-containing protein [Flavitalea antarctica]
MQPAHFAPPPALSPYIAFYGIFDVPDGFCEPYVSPPLALCGFIMSFHNVIDATTNGKLFMKDRCCATGQITAPMIGNVRGREKIVMVFIQPCGLYQLFGVDMSLLTNTSMPLQELLGQEEAEQFITKVNEAPDHAAIIETLDAFFLSRLPANEIEPKVEHAINYIHRLKGNVSIGEIESTCYITLRSLERYFKTYIGLTPKDYAKIYRFKCLMNYIHEHPGVTWNILCEENGYYDQAHLTRYFTRFLKIRPTDMVVVDMDYINYLLQA